ncbi:MAG TPA: aspartyl/asparaginyl beta-hydroxylase domain-containing protein [Planctomycetota bacterium]
MVYDLQATVIPTLERSFAFVRRELAGLDLDRDFFKWPQTEGYTGTWSVFGLFFRGEPYLPIDLAANQRRCPETTAMLRSLPRLDSAGFSLVGADSRILPHSDNYGPKLQRLHLGVQVPPGSEMIVAGKKVEWEEGRVVMFDRSQIHEVTNRSTQARVVLLCDFEVLD